MAIEGNQSLDTNIDADEVAARFGPFSPPETYKPETEFQPEPPRQIPERLRQGSYEKKFKQGLYVAFGVGAFCIAFSGLSFVKRIGYYILPLGYLNWIGYGIIAIVILAWLLRRVRAGHYNYVRQGIPIIARVLETDKLLGEEAVKELRFLTLIEFKHPESGEMTYTWTTSHSITSTTKPDDYDTTIKPGDYVTAAYLPDKLDKTLQIYGYLGLNPDVDFIRKNGKRITEHVTLGKTLAILCCIVTALVLLVGLIYTLSFYFPTEFNPWHFFGAILTVAIIGAITGLILRARSKPEQEKKEAGFLACGFAGFALGAFLACIILPLLNGMGNNGKPEYRDIEIVQFWQETWDFIIRQYEIEYRLLGEQKTDKRASMLENMGRFEGSMAGVLEIRTGLLGWKWISDMCPVVLACLNEQGQLTELTTEQIQRLEGSESDPLPFQIDFAIDRGQDGLMPISDDLRQHIINKLDQ